MVETDTTEIFLWNNNHGSEDITDPSSCTMNGGDWRFQLHNVEPWSSRMKNPLAHPIMFCDLDPLIKTKTKVLRYPSMLFCKSFPLLHGLSDCLSGNWPCPHCQFNLVRFLFQGLTKWQPFIVGNHKSNFFWQEPTRNGAPLLITVRFLFQGLTKWQPFIVGW